MHSTYISFNQFLSAATIGCLLFLAILAFYKKNSNSTGYKFLSLLFILIAFIFADDLLSDEIIYTKYPLLKVIFQPVLYAFPPFIYLVIAYLTSIKQKISATLVFYFIPYLIFLSLYIAEYFKETSKSQRHLTVPDSDNISFDFILLLVFFVQITIYLFFSIRLLNKHKKTLPLFVSSISDNDFHWLYNTIIGLSVMSVISLVEVIFEQMSIPFFYSLLYLFGFYYVGYQLVKQKDVFQFSPEQNESIADLINDIEQDAQYSEDGVFKELIDNDKSENTVPDRKKVISEEKMSRYKAELLALMEKEKPYLDSEITLPKLSKMLLLNTYQTSYLINTSFNENFYTFINRYRLEACKKMLIANEYNHLNILGVAFEAGFNSKTAFNTSFKKHTGLSPKEYIEQIKK